MIRYLLNLLGSYFRGQNKYSVARSSGWRKVEKEFVASHPTCAACSGNRHLQVHHIEPFHINAALELDPKNLITLCMGRKECHFKIAHGGNWKAYCPDVKAYVSQLQNKEKTFDEIYEIAAANKKV